MTSSFKGQTDNTPQSSSEGNTGELEPQSKQSANSDNTPSFMQTTSPLLKPIRNVGEKSRQHAEILKVVLSQLERSGLIKRYKVLSKDRTTVKEYQVTFDPAVWTENFDLKSVVEPDNRLKKVTK